MALKPFIKWTGKRYEVENNFNEIISYVRNTDTLTYVDPFVGSGRVFLDVLYNDKFANYKINDIIKPLMEVWFKLLNSYKSFNDDVIVLQEEYNRSSNKKEFFYYIRDRYNDIRLAEDLLFLMKCSFFSIYKENKRGGMFSSFGYSKEFVNEIYSLEQYKYYVKTSSKDYKLMIEENLNDSSLIYCDPPHINLNKKLWSKYDKVGIARDIANYMKLNSTPIICSNGDNDVVKDIFKGFRSKRVRTNKGYGRKSRWELMISNF